VKLELDLSDFEVFEVNTIVDDNKRSPDRKSDSWSQNIIFLSDLSDLSDFEVFEVNMIVNSRPIEKDTWSQNIIFLSDLSDFEVFEVNMIIRDNQG
jgi:hypothetical protein